MYELITTGTSPIRKIRSANNAVKALISEHAKTGNINDRPFLDNGMTRIYIDDDGYFAIVSGSPKPKGALAKMMVATTEPITRR